MGVLHPDLAALDPPDLPGCISQQEHVPGQAFDGKVLVDCAYKYLFRVENDIVICVVGYGPAAGHGGDWRPPPAFNFEVDTVSMKERPPPALAEGEPIG